MKQGSRIEDGVVGILTKTKDVRKSLRKSASLVS